MSDPMEQLISDALNKRGIRYTGETHSDNKSLDFYLPEMGVHIEVKQFHTPRVAEQMGRVSDVIVAQGRGAVEQLAAWIEDGDKR